MSSLTSSIASSWSGVSTYGKASSSSRCHGVSGAEGVAGGGHPGAVELDEAGGDLLDRLLRPALALGPVGAAEPVEASGASPPTYLVTSSSWSVGTKTRSPGWPFLLGANSRMRYSRVAPCTVRCTIST